MRIAERDGVAFAARPLPLRRIYLVERPPTRRSAPRIEAIPPREAIMSLLEYAFILDTEDRARIGAHFNRVASAAATLDIRRLVCPERAGAADALRELVRADAAEHR
jgi:hypothetical protein